MTVITKMTDDVIILIDSLFIVYAELGTFINPAIFSHNITINIVQSGAVRLEVTGPRSRTGVWRGGSADARWSSLDFPQGRPTRIMTHSSSYSHFPHLAPAAQPPALESG